MPEPDADSPDPPVRPVMGRARELSRTRTSRRKSADTGRRHHIGAVPEYMPVWRPDGSVGRTRTSPAQLEDRTPLVLTKLLAELERDMTQAAAELDFENAGYLRDEVAAVKAELERRAASD